jgi:hypothetical protein
MDGSLVQMLSRRATAALKRVCGKLRPDEAMVLMLLQQRIDKAGKRRRAA